jgi:predicted nucleotidyltransferase
MKSFYEIILEEAKSRKKYLDNYMFYAKIIKEKAKKLLKDAEVYVFGSVVRGDYNPMSDIDIMIVSEKVPDNVIEQAKIKAKILEDFEAGVFQIHLVKPFEYENWYKKFIKNDIIKI